ncbi:sensor domain-containing protein [Janthinobacterium sp. 1_2014MBL_MicDiv]|uniref:sensor domain-containing protein n=1 Tax=Janthinobacterium sp. 1_2014MBL_MicDiv TaxID=1644131 RepID=UPI0008F4ABAA|nr:EAL domain-containing protein [Janthinobacterium sp. 1_2014MBL_MicDiv]APA66965.1 diguanylate cyclase [Janthinobacterium sp. 1_2014MBL_MicDiv]
MSERIVGAVPSPGRLLAAAAPDTGAAGMALDLLSIAVAAVEQAPGMAVRGIDRDGIVRYWSAGAARLYGVPAALALGQPWSSVATAMPEGAGQDADGHAELDAVWHSGKARTARLWRLGSNGVAPRCICSTAFPVIVAGRVRQVVCIDVDITASGQDGAGQGALLLMGDNFRQLYDKSADAIVLLRDEHIAEANPAAIALFQCEERPRLLGRRLSDFSPLRQPDGALSSLRGTQLAAQAHAHGNWRYDWQYQTCLGELFWGEVLLTSVTLDHTYLFYAVIRDISSRKLAERALYLSAQVVEHAREAIVVMDPQQRVVSMNPAYSEISGFSLDDMLGKPFAMHRAEPDELAFFAHVWEEVDTNGYWQGDILAQRKEGQRYPAWLSLTAIRDTQGQLSNYMAILSDISERKKTEEHTRHLAEHDFLTDLPNRVLLLDRLSLALAAARRKLSMLAILYLDLDHFKHINDSMGHHVGDLLLKEVARRLVRCVRGVDTVSRHGGDEFVIILAEVGGIDQAAHVAASLLQAVTQVYQLGEYELQVSVSIGVAIFPSDGDSIDTLVHNADIAMYHAKESGRNNFQFFNAEMNAQILERASLEQGLRAALGSDEFALEFQPALDVASGQIVGAEALLRWRHPQLGVLPPERFLAVAEECGLMVSIGNWVLRHACLRARAWHDAGQAWRVSVNLSAAQCLHNNLVHSVQEALAASGLPAAWLELEVTESLLMKGGARLAGVLAQLRALGVRLAIDDFGTGYSRLANLRHYPVDKLKIDPSFLPGADGAAGESDTAVAATIIAMARELQLTVIAEGVETAQQLAYLQAQGCQQYQGRYAGAQVEGSALAALLH